VDHPCDDMTETVWMMIGTKKEKKEKKKMVVENAIVVVVIMLVCSLHRSSNLRLAHVPPSIQFPPVLLPAVGYHEN
jgi:hypothetical protein